MKCKLRKQAEQVSGFHCEATNRRTRKLLRTTVWVERRVETEWRRCRPDQDSRSLEAQRSSAVQICASCVTKKTSAEPNCRPVTLGGLKASSSFRSKKKKKKNRKVNCRNSTFFSLAKKKNRSSLRTLTHICNTNKQQHPKTRLQIHTHTRKRKRATAHFFTTNKRTR